MSDESRLTCLVETYRFADVVRLWARERLLHESVVARVLAQAVVEQGLRLQSTDTRWLCGDRQAPVLRRQPYVGFTSEPGSVPAIMRRSALDHLFAICLRGAEPELDRLGEEFVSRGDFRQWCERAGVLPPAFWFGREALIPA